jgi:hypothetical protein
MPRFVSRIKASMLATPPRQEGAAVGPSPQQQQQPQAVPVGTFMSDGSGKAGVCLGCTSMKPMETGTFVPFSMQQLLDRRRAVMDGLYSYK